MLPVEIAATSWQVVTAWVAQIRNGDPESILLAWGLTIVANLVLPRYLRRLRVRFRLLCERYGLRNERSGKRSADPPTVTTEQLKRAETANTQVSAADLWWTVETVVLMPVLEEIVFRGVPVLLARQTTGFTDIAVLVAMAATVVWAYLHVYFDQTPFLLPNLLSGLLLLYLWLHGLGHVAIGLHMLTNLVYVFGLVVRRFVRIVHPNVLAAGEEHWVTVSPHRKPSRGLYRATTKDGRRVDVTDVTPGETCLVRVATAGLRTKAYPVREAEAEGTDGPTDR
ncbi:CPBP family intramembrane glutamic endopeptidase [Halosimplex pelagicum]|uniref:CPBP family intramembrane metalloprotease n=1 Tax=Halosimplex pelagicum TaxID=869886 RepID=A0A7D5PH47_9EURY|nr:CPBP family intramembrane glutamic endopeptidase [Halosimplex pelagicum]QLH84819.1 CPBP family intramembrane metalloprotease [Halosimplex pelagicum]